MKTNSARLFVLVLAVVMAISLTACSAGTPAGNDSNATNYGTVDCSTAPQGHITFTAKGRPCVFILESPNGAQELFEAVDGDSIEIALTDGAGKYQYAITNSMDGGKSYCIMYKDSFDVRSIDTDSSSYSTESDTCAS